MIYEVWQNHELWLQRSRYEDKPDQVASRDDQQSVSICFLLIEIDPAVWLCWICRTCPPCCCQYGWAAGAKHYSAQSWLRESVRNLSLGEKRIFFEHPLLPRGVVTTSCCYQQPHFTSCPNAPVAVDKAVYKDLPTIGVISTAWLTVVHSCNARRCWWAGATCQPAASSGRVSAVPTDHADLGIEGCTDLADACHWRLHYSSLCSCMHEGAPPLFSSFVWALRAPALYMVSVWAQSWTLTDN